MLSDSFVSSAGVRKMGERSNLRAIDKTGVSKDAVISGRASIKRYLIAPNDKLYVEFSDYPNVDGAPCLLAEVSKATGLPTCIERDTEFLLVSPGQRGGFSWCPDTCGSASKSLVNDIQFDDRGAIYYMGIPNPKADFPNAVGIDDVYGFGFGDEERPGKLKASVGTIVRRYLNGVTTDFGLGYFYLGTKDEPGFSPGNVENKMMLGSAVTNFVVFGDGTLIIDQLLSTRPQNNTINPANCEFHRLDRWSSSGIRQSVAGILPVVNQRSLIDSECQRFLVDSMNGDPDVFLLNPLSLIKIDAQTLLAIGQPRFGVNSPDQVADSYMFKISAPFAMAEEISYISVPPVGGTRSDNTDTRCSEGVRDVNRDYRSYICQRGSSMIRGAWRTPNGEWFAVVGQDRQWNLRGSLADLRWKMNDPSQGYAADLGGFKFGSGVLVRLLPSFEPTRLGLTDFPTDLQRVETYLPILDSIVASGTDGDGLTRAVLYNTVTRSHRQLLGPSDGISPTHFVFNAGQNVLLFAGIASNDDRIIGTIDLRTGTLAVIGRSRSANLDLRAFSS